MIIAAAYTLFALVINIAFCYFFLYDLFPYSVLKDMEQSPLVMRILSMCACLQEERENFFFCLMGTSFSSCYWVQICCVCICINCVFSWYIILCMHTCVPPAYGQKWMTIGMHLEEKLHVGILIVVALVEIGD